MSIEKTKKYFKKWNMDHRILELEESCATVELAAEAIGCEPERIAKSLTFNVDHKPVLIVVAGDARIDNPKFKEEFSTKAKMLKADEVLDQIGHDVGGVCPFGINEDVTVYLDKSLKRFKSLYPACGSSNSVIELTIEELEKHSNYSRWVDIARGWK